MYIPVVFSYDNSYDEQLAIFLFCSAFINHVSFISKKMCCADRSWKFIFWPWKSHGKSLLKKSGHPVHRNGLSPITVDTT